MQDGKNDDDKKNSLFTRSGSNISRYTTEEEREHIKEISFSKEEMDKFLTMMREGLLDAGGAHEAAVQNNMALSAEVTIKLSRPVQSPTGSIKELTGTVNKNFKIEAKKVFYTETELEEIRKQKAQEALKKPIPTAKL